MNSTPLFTAEYYGAIINSQISNEGFVKIRVALFFDLHLWSWYTNSCNS